MIHKASNSSRFSAPEAFVTCLPGYEDILQQEIQEDLHLGKCRKGKGGVYVSLARFEDIYSLNLNLRTATRVLLPLSKFICRDDRQLYAEVYRQIEWAPFFRRAKTLAIDANVIQHPGFKNSLYAAQVVKDAICDQLRETLNGWRPSVDLKEPDVQLNLFITSKYAILSFDTSGTPLYKRGYRVEGGQAPMRETLAALILKLAGVSKPETLLDPCCGSGTILIEAALIMSKTPAGFLRHNFGFMYHPQFHETAWLKCRNHWMSFRQDLPLGLVMGIEKDRETYEICRQAISAVGLKRQVQLCNKDFREADITIAPTLCVTNPPYGQRLGSENNISQLYADLGAFLNHLPDPLKSYIFTSNTAASFPIPLSRHRQWPLKTGSIDACLVEYFR